MAAAKKRINISVSNDVEKAVSVLAKRDQVPQATKAAQLLQFALEMEEDQILDQIASKRDTKLATFVAHKKAWE